MSNHAKRFYEFGPYRLDPGDRLLLRQGSPLPLPPKVYDTLLVLVQNHGRLIEKDELMKAVWPDTFVEEANLTVNISALRKVLAEGSGDGQYIETVPRRGYRFAPRVTEVVADTTDLPEVQSPVCDSNNTQQTAWSRGKAGRTWFGYGIGAGLVLLAATLAALYALHVGRPRASP